MSAQDDAIWYKRRNRMGEFGKPGKRHLAA